MERITINVKGEHGGLLELDVKEIVENRDGLSITLNDKSCYLINPGQRLILKRHIYCDGGDRYSLTEYVSVISENENHVITTTLPPVRKRMIDNEDIKSGIESGIDGKRSFAIVKCRAGHNLFAQDIDMTSVRKPQTMSGYTGVDYGHELVLYVYEGNETYRTSEIAVLLKRSDRHVTIDDCISHVGTVETCGKSYDEVNEYLYEFLPERASRDCLIIYFDEVDRDTVINGIRASSYFISKYNPFYWYYVNYTEDKNGRSYETDKYGDYVKHCVLWGDSWWDNILKSSLPNDYVSEDRIYYTSGSSKSMIAFNNSYWDINTGIGMKGDMTSLGSEDEFKTSFIENLKETLVPEVIDMERLKYIPMVCAPREYPWKYHKWASADGSGKAIYTTVWRTTDNTDNGDFVNAFNMIGKGNFTPVPRNSVRFAVFHDIEHGDTCALLRTDEKRYYYPTDEIATKENFLTTATGITMSLHFRKRVTIPDEKRGENTQATSGNVYYDGWYVDSESGDTMWWNGYEYNGSGFSASMFTEFVKESGLTSDLIGYLNFTDNDVYYSKLKVSQSFIRMLFYDSTDPLTQRLLYTSTVFLDGGSLYGKYIKQHLYMEDSGYTATMDDNENALVVFCESNAVSARVDTEISITNEYDRTKSAEGFNIYLFAKDKLYGMKNGSRTIYMKVEFNHAGNGKTLPMIQWPTDDNGNYIPLTVSNFMESLYIPIELAYYEDRYIYYIRSAYENNADGTIKLVLFEPKIENESETADTGGELTKPLPSDWRQQINDMVSQIG